MAKHEMNDHDVSGVRGLLLAHREALDWGRFLDLAARHRLLPLVGRNIILYRLDHDADRKPLTPYRQVFSGAYVGNRVRNQVQHAEYASVLNALNVAGVRYLVRKGPVLDTYGFADLGARQSSDLDLLLDRLDMGAFGAVAEKLGYQQGLLAPDGTVRPYSRRAQVYWKAHLNNSLPFVKYSGSVEVNHFKVDPCHQIAQKGAAVEVTNADLFARSVAKDICGVASRTMSEVDQMLDLCLHLHKEATALYYLESGKGLRLRQLLDIVVLTRAWPEETWNELIELAHACSAATEIYYALHFASLCYPEAIPQRALASVKPKDTAYLEDFGHMEGKPGRWRASFFERLLGDDQVRTTSSEVPRM
ncbi:nucleotidyltransferase family protein [Nonomuraea wenchangensis]|uniref:nucleotidyltransferase family protein n=1 Tax=Nonomuraea wenchangensis TaxID=568860 RepID=UPI00379FDA7D